MEDEKTVCEVDALGLNWGNIQEREFINNFMSVTRSRVEEYVAQCGTDNWKNITNLVANSIFIADQTRKAGDILYTPLLRAKHMQFSDLKMGIKDIVSLEFQYTNNHPNLIMEITQQGVIFYSQNELGNRYNVNPNIDVYEV